MFASFVPGTSILNVTEMFSTNSPSPNGPGSSFTISGNTPPGGGVTSTITISGGFETTINGMNAVTFTSTYPGAISQINVSFLNDNDSLTVGTPTGIINLPGTTLNVMVGGGHDTFMMGTAGSASVPEVNNALNAVNFKAANVNSTGTETFSILDAKVSSVTVQENSGPGDVIQLWGVTANGQVNLSQGNGNGSTISIDELQSTNPGPVVTTIPSIFGVLKTNQGNGNGDNTTINRTQARVSLTGTQGDADRNSFFLGSGVTVGSVVAPAISNGPAIVFQGTGNADYIGVDNLNAGTVTLTQQDQATNATGDTVGGVATNAIPPGTIAGFPAAGLDTPGALTAAKVVTATGDMEQIATVPTNGFANATVQQLNIAQGSAAGDTVALVQLPANSSVNESLTVTGAPFIAGAPNVPGTLTITQQDVAGNSSDFVFMGSFTPGTGPFGTSGTPPYPYTNPLATGSITATNEVVVQGDASGDVLSVLFNTDTSPTTQLSSVFIQGNGGDDAFFQRNTALTGGLFNYSGGSGGNYVQADSNNAIGTFDGGPNVMFNLLGQDNNNAFLNFVDFGNLILA